MTECDLCNNLDLIHYRVKSLTTKTGFFAVKNVGISFQKKINIYMEGPENQKFKKNI